MTIMTIDDFRRILEEIAGADDKTRSSEDIAELTFEGLGYDSLALMECVARIQQEYGIQIPDDAIFEAETPRAMVELVNRAAVTAS